MALILSCLGGCDKISQENYDQLKVGMEYPSVVKLLGEPKSCETFLMAKQCRFGEDPKTINVKLISDKVILFSSAGL